MTSADTTGGSLRLAVVTNIPAPYRVPVYNLLASEPGIDLKVFYAAHNEPDRLWELPRFEHAHVFLEGRMVERAGRFIHFSRGVWRELRQFAPDVLITTGYNPTHLLAYLYARLHARRHVPMTDGSWQSERSLSLVHRTVRRVVFRGSRTFVAAGLGGRRLFRSYGVPADRIHLSPLCANPTVDWTNAGTAERRFDLLFSGRFVESKNPGFALRLAQSLAQQLGRRVVLALLGKGPLEDQLRRSALTKSASVDVHFLGHASQSALPAWFAQARLFVFPTLWDPWGVVVNEACAAGTPVIVSPHAGAAGDLIQDGLNGRVLPLDLALWTSVAAELLLDEERYRRMAVAARQSVAPYSIHNAAAGMLDAVRQAATGSAARRTSTQASRLRVVCVQRRLPHYRVPFFESLRAFLAERHIDFVLVHGQPAPDEVSKQDSGSLMWAEQVHSTYLFGGRLCWQPLAQALEGADLVILSQENKLIYNLIALFLRRPDRLAFWGHGRNFQSARPDGIKERFKAWTVRKVDWWFAYTQLSADQVRQAGMPADRITVVGNAIDTDRLASQCRQVSAADMLAARVKLGIEPGPVAIFVGSLYADKRLDFLMEAAMLLRASLPGFTLLMVGEGPLRAHVEQVAGRCPFIKVLGACHGDEKALLLRIADVMMNPGLVGLSILDSFAAGLPLITTDCRIHSPEIAYLRHGVNGLMTADNLDAYVCETQRLLDDPQALSQMVEAASASASELSISKMAMAFGSGIVSALECKSGA